jgi:threonine dehydratase
MFLLTRTIEGATVEGMQPLTSSVLAEARSLVGQFVPPTPQFVWPLLAEQVGTEVWTKHENMTPTGAFKVRGGIVYAERIKRERPEVRGLASATRGNHGQSLAYAGRAFGLEVVIAVPEGNSVEKNAAMRGMGAEVVIEGKDFDEARAASARIAKERGLEPVPPFADDLVIGVATYAAELFDAAGALDRVYVPVGMGSGISGLIAVRDLLGLDTEIIGVVSDAAPSQAKSFAAKSVVTTESACTFVDGVACRQPDPAAVAWIAAGATDVIMVSDDETADAMRMVYKCTHHLPEPAGAIAFAGLWSQREQLAGKRVGWILCGSNMDTCMAAAVLGGHTPQV